MASPHNTRQPIRAGEKQNDKDALFRRASEATRTSQLLIDQTEELLQQTRLLFKKPEKKR